MDTEQGSGWLTFAAVILVFTGIMKIFDSIWAFRAKGSLDDYIPGNSPGTLSNSFKAYGLFWLVLGVLLILAGFAVLQRSQVARWFGVLVAAVAGVGSLAWMPYFPLWAFTYVLIAVLVIYALVAHGGLEIPSQITDALPDIGGGGGGTGGTPPPPAPPTS